MGYYVISSTSVVKVHRGTFRRKFDGTYDDVSVIENAPEIVNKLHSEANKKKVCASVCKKMHVINRSVVRKRCRGFFDLDQSKEFIAFFSVSFPFGIKDDDALRLWNIWLTRCRKEYGKFSFLWITERQKNGTIHFHMLTNVRMPILKINGFMKSSLLNLKQQYDWNDETIDKYSGVDVDNLYFPKWRKGMKRRPRLSKEEARNRLKYYLTKYMNKSGVKFSHAAWHCSRDISKLATCEYFEENSGNTLISMIKSNPDRFDVYVYDYYTVYFPKVQIDLLSFTDITVYNQTIYDNI